MNLKSDATSAEIIDYLFTLKELHLFDIFFNSRVELLEPTIIENLLQHLSDRNAEYGHGEADRLSRVLSIYLGYAYLFSFMMSQEEGTLTFAEQHEDNLFTPYNFTLLNRRIDSAKDNNTFNYYNYYLSVLCRLAASRLLQSIGNWKLTRLILLSRAEWLMHKEAQARFEIFRTKTQ